MSPFEQFSEEIDLISKLHSASRLVRVVCRIEYWWRKHWQNQPMSFRWVRNEGEPVGEAMNVYHLSLHDMMEHETRGQLTAEVLLKGRRINAFSVESFQRMEKMVGKTTIQPRWV